MKDQYTLEDSHDAIRLQEAWNNVLRRLQPDVPPAWFERFIRPLAPSAVVDDTVTVHVPGRFVMEWVRERYLATLQQLLGDELGHPVTVDLKPELQKKKSGILANAGVALPANQTPAAASSAFTPNPRYSFDSFVVGDSNRLAFAGARAVAAQPGKKYNPLFIYGPSGLGKTHLLMAIAAEVAQRDPKVTVVYKTAQQFAEEFVNALQNNRSEQFRRSHRNVGLWLLDDIQFIVGKDKTSEEVFHTFNHLQQLGKQIVICADRSPRDLYGMDDRLRSRFECGLVADIQMPDTETRCAILLSKARQENVDLSNQVAMYLAENVPGNIRVLEGALTKLAVQASVEGKEVSMELATKMVETYFRSGTLTKPSFNQIVEAVSKHYKIPVDDIMGTSRKAPIVHARHVAVFVTREITGDSWKHIGTQFGDRDHTSMMHGYQKIGDMIRQDRDLKTQIKSLIRNLYPEA